MDTYITNDINNPINHETKTLCCDICGIEEYKTYFIDYTQICEDCINESSDEKTKLELSQKELNLLLSALYFRFEEATENKHTLVGRLTSRLVKLTNN